MVQLREPWVTEPDEAGRGFLPVYDTREAEGQWLLAIGEIPPMPSGIHLELTDCIRACIEKGTQHLWLIFAVNLKNTW